MSAPKHFKVEVRITEALFNRLCDEVERVSELAGVAVTRSAVLEDLIEDSLDRRTRITRGSVLSDKSDSPRPSARRRRRSR